MKIVIPENPTIGIVLATHASIPYIHLGLEALRRNEPDVRVLIHDDDSHAKGELKLLAAQYGADFVTTDFRKAPTVGDLSAFAEGLKWGEKNGLDIVVKCSRRLILNRPWADALRDLMVNTQYCTACAPCGHYQFGFRSEWVAMYVPMWIASGAWAEMAEVVRQNKAYDSLPEAWDHHRARDVHKFAHPQDVQVSRWVNANDPEYDELVRHEMTYKRPDNYDGYTWFAGLLGLSRHQRIKGTLWHDWAMPPDYYALSQEFGLPYTLDQFNITPGQ